MATATATRHPQTHRALLLTSITTPPSLTLAPAHPFPAPAPGSAVIKVLATYILPYQRAVLTGSRGYTLFPPLVPGNAAIGRVVAVGADATLLKAGMLVLGDVCIGARDAPSAGSILMGLHGGIGPEKRLMEGEWRDGTFAEYARFPLENLAVLDEGLLLGPRSAGKGLGYSLADLAYLSALLVPFGGLASVELGPGQSIVIAPATGRFGGAAVGVALGMGARVVAAGRNRAVLDRMEAVFAGQFPGRFLTVVLSGEVDVDGEALRKAAGGVGAGADAYLDFSPAEAAKGTHIIAALKALKTGGRAVFMGGIRSNVEIPYALVMMRSLRIQGRFMYERKDVRRLVGMVEAGLIKLGVEAGIENLGPYGLEGIEEALEVAEKNSAWGTQVVLMP